MKKRSGLQFYILFFIACIIMETYCFLELRDDLITIVAMSIVVLISAYLVLDGIRARLREIRVTLEKNRLSIENLEKKLEYIEKLEKANYIYHKKNYDSLKNMTTNSENNTKK